MNRRPVWLLLILIAGKTLFLVLRGVSYEMDTATYLNYLLPFHHPPLYSILLHLLHGLYPSVFLVAGLQVLLFAAAATFFIEHFVRTRGQRYAVAVIFALEPTTSFFCANMMSEGLFIPLLMVWACLADGYLEERDNRRAISLLLWVALVSALLYATRLQGLILLPLIPLLHLLRQRDLKRTAWHLALLLIAFQIVLVPFKLAYLNHYGSYSFTLFTGTPLWNSASVLYPESGARVHPQTEFEHFLAQRDLDEFTIDAALSTETLFNAGHAYEQFLRQKRRGPDELRRLERSLAGTSMRIIIGNPLGYVTRLVVPNYLNTLSADEEIVISPEVARLMSTRYGYQQSANVRYHGRTWVVWLAILIAATGAHLLLRRGGRGATLLLACCWYHTLLLPAISVVFLRYLLIVVPWLLMAAWLVATVPGKRTGGQLPWAQT